MEDPDEVALRNVDNESVNGDSVEKMVAKPGFDFYSTMKIRSEVLDKYETNLSALRCCSAPVYVLVFHFIYFLLSPLGVCP